MKKILLVIIFFGSTIALANVDEPISIQIQTNDQLYERLLNPLWQSIPYEYQWKSNISHPEQKKSTLSYSLKNATLNLGQQGTPLIKLQVVEENKIKLNWLLQNINVDALVKVTFKFTKFGIKVTHNELFKVKAWKIKKAQSIVNLSYQENKFNLDVHSNSGFAFENVKVTPKDGVGEVLKWIFDNIFSEKEVNNYLKKEINKEIAQWANDKEIIQELEKQLNEEINTLEDLRIKVSEAATEMRAKVDTLSITPAALKLNLKTTFDDSNQELHLCANEIENNDQKNSQIKVTHNFVQKILNNFTSFKIYEEGKLIEPLFCYGYKKYDQEGKPEGNLETIKLMAKKTTFKYWIKPKTYPRLSYLHEKNLIEAKLKVKVLIEGIGYPKLYTKNEAIYADIKGTFEIKHDEKLGIILVYKDFKIETFEGKLRLKYFKVSPPIPLPKNKIKQELEKFIQKELSENYATIGLIDPEIELENILTIKTIGHHLTKEGHTIDFNIIDNLF